MKTANLFIYLQALGGKFLGPNAYDNANINVSFQYSGGQFNIPYQVIASTNDGAISPIFTAGSSSPMPILTPASETGQNPSVNYLTANINTIMGLSNAFSLPEAPELATLTVSIPTPSGKNLSLSQGVWLFPEQQLYKITVIVPGLLVEPNTPPSSTEISVYVKMMCGCKVSVNLPTSFWSPSDFMVNASVTFNDGTTQQYALCFYNTSNDSLFIADVPNANQIQSISYYAQQNSTGNYGELNYTK